MKQLVVCVLLVCSVLLLGSCVGKYRLEREDLTIASAWPFARGQADSKGSLVTGQFPGKLDVIWQQNLSDKPAGPLTIYHGALIYPGTKKKARFFDTETGRSKGVVKVKGVPKTGLVIQDSVAYFGVLSKRNRLYGVDLVNKKRVLRTSVKDPAPGSIIVDNRLLVSSGEGRLVAYDLRDYSQAWEFSAEGKFVASAACSNDKVFQPDDRGVLHTLSLSDGEEIFVTQVAGPIVSPVAVGDNVYAADVLGNVYAISPESGEILWQVDIGGSVWTSPAIAGSRLFVGHSEGQVVALDAISGEELWRFETSEVVRASPLVVDDWVVVGTMGGKLFLIDATDGKLVASKELKGAIFFPPVTDGERLYVATQAGRVICFGEQGE